MSNISLGTSLSTVLEISGTASVFTPAVYLATIKQEEPGDHPILATNTS